MKTLAATAACCLMSCRLCVCENRLQVMWFDHALITCPSSVVLTLFIHHIKRSWDMGLTHSILNPSYIFWVINLCLCYRCILHSYLLCLFQFHGSQTDKSESAEFMQRKDTMHARKCCSKDAKERQKYMYRKSGKMSQNVPNESQGVLNISTIYWCDSL